MRLLVLFCYLFCFLGGFAQEKITNKGKIFAFWGWNRSGFTNSNIQFTGNDYDFTLNNVAANDRYTPFDAAVYFHPRSITIPQTNFTAGYYLKDDLILSFNIDHMKYVMVQDQTVKISGFINQADNAYNGTFSDNDILLEEDFLIYEHTDGLNYVNFSLLKSTNLFDGLIKQKIPFQIDWESGGGLGFLLPKTKTIMFDNDVNDEFHLSGYGFNISTGVRATFLNHFFIRTDLKGGFINMPDIRTTNNPSDRAKQHFWFRQVNWGFGYTFSLGAKE